MKLLCNRQALLDALDRAGSSTDSKHVTLKHVMVTLDANAGVLELVGACAAGEMRATLGVEPGAEGGAALVEPKQLAAALRAIGGDVVRLTETKGKLAVDSPKVKGRAVKGIGLLDASEFPPRRALADGEPTPAGPVLRGIRAVKAFASTDDARPHLASVYVDASEGDTQAVATNGGALGVYRCDAKLTRSVLLPAPAIAVVSDLEAETLRVSSTEPAFATFSGAGWTYTNVPLGTENKFPSWRQVVPQDKPAATLECDSADLSRAAGDVMAVCVATKAVIVDVSADAATVQTPKDAEPSFSAEIAGKITGSVRTALPAKQLRDALAQCSGRVAVTLLGTLDPARVDSGEAFFAILMPWRGL